MATRTRFEIATVAAAALWAVCVTAPVRAEGPSGGTTDVTVERPAAGNDTPVPATPPTEPFEDRWRMQLPPYKLNETGHWWDPYHQNVLKGDIPVIGDDIFLRLTGISKDCREHRDFDHRFCAGEGNRCE